MDGQRQAELREIPIDELYPHPDNPRLMLREDVVEQIAEQLREQGAFGREHAPIVREFNGGYQIASGHTRRVAAERAGVRAIPCWVKDMDDDEAFMMLVLSNAQGELSPLEIGVHALRAVPLGKRGRGNIGDGLKSYAKRIGRSEQQVGHLRSAAEVLKNCMVDHTISDFLTRSEHLYEVSRAPRELWPQLVDRLLKQKWTVADIAAEVNRINNAEKLRQAEEARLAGEETEAQKFIEEHAPDLAAAVGGDIKTYVEALAVWEKRNREEAKRIQDEKDERDRAIRHAFLAVARLETSFMSDVASILEGYHYGAKVDLAKIHALLMRGADAIKEVGRVGERTETADEEGQVEYAGGASGSVHGEAASR